MWLESMIAYYMNRTLVKIVSLLSEKFQYSSFLLSGKSREIETGRRVQFNHAIILKSLQLSYTSFWFSSNRTFISSNTCRMTSSYNRRASHSSLINLSTLSLNRAKSSEFVVTAKFNFLYRLFFVIDLFGIFSEVNFHIIQNFQNIAN